MLDPTQRFSSRVQDYIKYRPAYPPAIVGLLEAECGLRSDSIIADIGSGTGILTELFLKNGNIVYGVEPNREMREAGERLLQDYSRFKSIDGRAEETTLPDQGVHFVIAGQAFHWFDRAKTRVEFERILKSGGWVVLVWNDRRTTSTPFLEAYERLLMDYSIDYEAIKHKEIDHKELKRFFAPGDCKLEVFENFQRFDLSGLKGRLLSSSYAPEAGHPNHKPMLARLRHIFETHQVDGEVVFEYDTQVYYSRIAGDS